MTATDADAGDQHQDGNALADLFATDITLVVRRCASCGDASPLGAHRLYRSAGLVLRCPTCSDVALRAIDRDGTLSLVWAGVFEVPAPSCDAARSAHTERRAGATVRAMSDWASWTARAVRAAVFRTFADEGRAPSAAELATLVRVEIGEVKSALEELHALHALVLSPEGDAIRMAHPFSAAPMSFVVRGACDSLWWGGCAWDSFGIVAAVGEELSIETQCPCCRTDLRYTAAPDAKPTGAPDGAVVHVPRPAREWWDDVVATCTHIRTFCSADHAASWAERTHNAPGEIVPLEQLWALAQPWYGDRLDPDWAPHTREHNQALLEQHGFTGDFWRLP